MMHNTKPLTPSLASQLLILTLLGCNPSPQPGSADATANLSRMASDCLLDAAYPFRLAPELQAAGYGLNTNDDGIQNFGEVATDCGGAGMSACVETVPLDVVIESTEMLPLSVTYGYEFYRITGTLNGREFQMIRPERDQFGFARQDVGVVMEMPTRNANEHKPPPTPIIETPVLGQELGATVIAMTGVTGVHPFVHSAQEAVLASRYLREALDVETVVVTGMSYGGAAALTDAALYPQHFDGVVALAAPYDTRTYLAWLEWSDLLSMAANLPEIAPRYYRGLDSMTMAARQQGLRLDNLNLTRLENARIPTKVILGETDLVWMPGRRPAEDMAQMQAEGIDYIDLVVVPEEGHGGPLSGVLAWHAYEEMYQLIDQRRGAGHVNEPAACVLPREPDTVYDGTLRAAPSIVSNPKVTELWSDVTQLEHGDMAGSMKTSNGSIYSGSLQGDETRRDVADPQTPVWSTLVGRAVQSVDLADGMVVVGSKRGIAVLDAASGQLIRETTGIGTVNDVVVADLIPRVPGLEIAAKADMDILHVESLSGGTLLSSTSVGTGGSMVWSSVLGGPHLLVPLHRGLVAAMIFDMDASGAWVPEATWLTDYLQHSVLVVLPTTVNGESVLVTGGHAYAEDVRLMVTDTSGAIVAEHTMWPKLSEIHDIVPWAEGEVLVAGSRPNNAPDGVYLVDLETGSITEWQAEGASVAPLEPGNAKAGAVVWNHGLNATPFVRIVDADGQIVFEETGRMTTPAIDLFASSEDGVFELSVMDHDWNIERFDLFSGDALGSVAWPEPAEARSAPRRLVRVDSGTSVTSYEPFLFDGDVLTGGIRVGLRCGQWIASTSLAQEHANETDWPDPLTKWCMEADWDADYPTASPDGYPTLSTPVGARIPQNEGGDIRMMDLDGPNSHAVMSTPGGQVALFSVQDVLMNAGEPMLHPPAMVADVAGTMTSLAVTSHAEDLIAVGSWFAPADGKTLHLLEPNTLDVVMAVDAGPVLGVAFADIDNDGHDEVLAGTQDGYLRAYQQDGREVLAWSAGDLAVGVNGALYTHDDNDQTVVAVAVAGGWRVLSISP